MPRNKRMKIVIHRKVADGVSGTAAEMAVRYGGFQAENEFDAILSIPPRRTGRKYKRGGVVHQASKAGESPAPDTGELRQSVKSYPEPVPKGWRAIVGTPLKRGRLLHEGTERIQPRPWADRLTEPARFARIRKAAIAGIRRVFGGK